MTTTSAGELEPTVLEGTARAIGLVPRDGDAALVITLVDDEATARRGDGTAYAVATEHLHPDREARCARVSMHEGDPMRDVSPAPLVGLAGLAGALMLVDRRSGAGLGVLLFESEDALERGDAYVRDAPPGTAGAATQVELYDVAFVT